MKKLLISFSIVALCVIPFSSCSNEEESSKAEVSSECRDFVNAYNHEIGNVRKYDIHNENKHGVRKAISRNDNLKSAYLSFPDNTPNEVKALSSDIKTARDFTDIMRLTAATVQLEPNNDNQENAVAVDYNQIRVALNPLVASAKEYLYSKGLTETDINDMIIENDAEMIDLVPFVLLLTEYELQYDEGTVVESPDFPQIPESDFSNRDIVSCGIHAIGMDLFYSFGGSTLKSWGKAAIKKAFGVIAKRALGPLGCIIAVAEFSYCLYEKYEKSSFAIPNERSAIEIKYESIIAKHGY